MVERLVLRAWLILLLPLVSAAGAWAFGNAETPADKMKFVTLTATEGRTTRQYLISGSTSMGAAVVTLKLDGTGIKYWGVREGTTYSGASMPDTMKSVLDANYGPDREHALTAPSDRSMPVTSAKAVWGSGIEVEKIPVVFRAPPNSVEIPIVVTGKSDSSLIDPTLVRVLLVRSDGSWERLEFYIEFFQGEHALFSTYPYPYYQKALAFMDSFFVGTSPKELAERAAFRTAAAAYIKGKLGVQPSITDSFWDMMDGDAQLATCQQVFRSVFKRHLSLSEEAAKGASSNVSVSYVRFDPAGWNQVYGADRSIYMAVYLRFLFDEGKPILSKVLNQQMMRLDSGYTYDWSQYEKLGTQPADAADGQHLAQAALRYLTWGVEYSLAGEPEGSARNEIYADNSAEVQSWVTAGGADRGKNYADGSIDALEAGSLQGDETKLGAGWLTTPFKDKARGNPLPYARMGIDSPRSFAYKMWEQQRLRDWAQKNGLSSTLGTIAGRGTAGAEGMLEDEYIDEAELLSKLSFVGRSVVLAKDSTFYKTYTLGQMPRASERTYPSPYASGTDVLKPFIPGTGTEPTAKVGGENSRNGLYNADKMAGVDSIGLLVGSLAMADSGMTDSVLMKRILGIANQKSAEKMDSYYHMAASSPGLDPTSKRPIFYADPTGSYSLLNGGYRLSRTDLERATVLVPDLSDIAVGDLLVKDGTEDGFQVGIVVGFSGAPRPGVGQDGTSFMNEVIVLSVDRQARRVYLKRWVSLTEPKTWQARRLLKLKSGGSATVAYGGDAWELVDTGYSGLSIALTWSKDFTAGVKSRWIPNTGELLVIASIEIQKQTPWGAAEDFAGGEVKQVAILGPKDYGYKETELRAAGSSNVYTNQGGAIEFWALQSGKTPLRLATFEGQSLSDEYKVVLNSDLYGSDGRLKQGYSLYLEDKRLRFKGGRMDTSQFGLRIGAGVARPGDDLLLRFGAMDGSGKVLATGTVAEKDYAAVYDKKLLWRANLYIDEGQNDWNNLNPWNAPPDAAAEATMRASGTLPNWWTPACGYNEWNRRWEPSTATVPKAYSFSGLTDLPVGNGTQVVKSYPDWTRWIDGEDGNRGTKTAVAYAWGGTDDPFDFIWKLRHSDKHQAEAVYLRAEAAKPPNQQSNPPAPSENLSNLPTRAPLESPAQSTLPGGLDAPINRWYRYVFATSQLDPQGWYKYSDAAVAFTVNGKNHTTNPYVPGLSMFHKDDGSYEANQVRKSAGIDCSGLAQASMSYAGNPYNVPSFRDGAAGRDDWTTYRDVNSRAGTGGLFEHSTFIAKNNDAGVRGAGGRIIPGDILISSGVHVAIVSLVEDRNGDSSITRDEIRLIEAAAGNLGVKNSPLYCVMDTRTAAGYDDSYSFRRMHIAGQP